MNAIALLAASFVTIAVVGTLLAAVHDWIAAAVAGRRATSEAIDRSAPRPMNAVVFRPVVDRPPSRCGAAGVATRVHARPRSEAVVPGARA